MKPQEVKPGPGRPESKEERDIFLLCRASPCLDHISPSPSERNRPNRDLDGACDQTGPTHPNLQDFSFSFPVTDEGAVEDAAEAEGPEEFLGCAECHAVSTPPDNIDKNPFLDSPEAVRGGENNPQVSSNPSLPGQDRRALNFSLPVGAARHSGERQRKTSAPLQETPTRKRVIRPDNFWQKLTPYSTVSAGPGERKTSIPSSGGHLAKGKEPVIPQDKAVCPRVDLSATPENFKTSHQKPEKPPKTAFLRVAELTPSEEKFLTREIETRLSGVAPSREEASVSETPLDQSQSRIAVTKMDLLHPESAAAMTEHRREAVRLAQAQEAAVVEKCKRAGQDVPDYTFDELIGKGSFGRVYKGRSNASSRVVAIKVIDIDEADFHAVFEQQDEQIKDFNKEIRILKQAQSSGAENLNQMIEALPVHSQLWLICEYCPGGSVKTLMRATNDRLAEQYIVVVARELGKALKGLHQAGIIHRDVKAANVLIHEEGRLQLCDFGVATVLDSRTDKRKTFIGTPHWMPPELFVDKPEYSDEVDVWEFGCTLYECALGKPPNSDLRERVQLGSRMRRLKEPISLPEHEQFSDGLRSLVRYTLSPNAKERPSMVDVLNHEYLVDTESTYPTSSLTHLVRVYYGWLYSGGQRASLFMPGGAVVSDAPGSLTTPIDEWSFSTTDTFEKRISAVMDLPTISEPSDIPDPRNHEGEATPKAPKDMRMASPLQEMSNAQRANFEARVKRGADLSHVFDQSKPDYEYKTKTDFRPVVEERRISDLPFRVMAEDRPTSIASNVIDLGDFDSEDYAIAAPKKEEPTIQLADAATIRAKRGDSKGPRDKSAQDALTAKRTASAEDLTHGRGRDEFTSAQDFAFPPKEWTTHDPEADREDDDDDMAHTIAARGEGRKTMEWTFPTTASPRDVEEEPTHASPTQAERTNKHATLDWSFSTAMAEADSDTLANTTPSRPAVSRTMTMPVTSTELHTAEEHDHPRPSTAMSSSGQSESSLSSADFDPFALEGNQAYPDAIASHLDGLGMTDWYTSRGSVLVPPHAGHYDDAGAAATARPYPTGPPARIGEADFPGPAADANPNIKAAKKKKNKKKAKKAKPTGDTTDRPHVAMPVVAPPSAAALHVDARSGLLEGELTRLLGGLMGALGGVNQALSIMGSEGGGGRRGRQGRGGMGRGSSSEWEDEE